jgi:hypothetical protein
MIHFLSLHNLLICTSPSSSTMFLYGRNMAAVDFTKAPLIMNV